LAVRPIWSYIRVLSCHLRRADPCRQLGPDVLNYCDLGAVSEHEVYFFLQRLHVAIKARRLPFNKIDDQSKT